MDENYLDNLLNEFSLDKEIDNSIEEEIDEQIRKEKDEHTLEHTVSSDELFDMDLKQDAEEGTPEADIDFSEDQIEELDQLDNLADLDIGDLDFADLDFDDLDITKLSDEISDSDFDDLLRNFDGNMEIPSFEEFGETSDISEDAGNDTGLEGSMGTDTDFTNASDSSALDNFDNAIKESNDVSSDQNEERVLSGSDSIVENEKNDNDINGAADDLNEDNFDADSFLDSLLADDFQDDTEKDDNGHETGDTDKDTSGNETGDSDNVLDDALTSSEDISDSDSIAGENNDDHESLDDMLSEEDSVDNEENDHSSDKSDGSEDDSGSEDDLFAMLGLDEQSGESTSDIDSAKAGEASENSEPDTSALEGLEDIQDITEKPKKKKRSFMEILFGPPDEDDEPTEEELKAIEEKKAAKKAKKEAAAEAKKAKAENDKAEKNKKDADKKRAADEKSRVKAEKKANKKAALEANAEPEKKLNKPAVIFIFSLFLGGVGFFYLSSVDFNYKLAIENATNYFASQKYHKAYDEIKGVDVKEKDKELKDRIYTVMYVERLYEGYENNMKLGRQKKALDSLLRGVDKYYEYYDEAMELDIVSDIDYSFSQIQNALQQNYGITVERALEINDMNDYDYMKTIEEYTGVDEKE